MRNHLNKINFVFLVLLSILIGCSKDDPKPQVENSLTLSGQTFNVTTASLIGITLGGSGHAAVQFVQTNGSIVKTLSIDFEYFIDKPVAGVYSFPQTTTTRYLDDWLTNYTEMNGTTMNSFHLVSGTVTIKENGGSNYTVTIDLTLDGGKTFKGIYKGDFITQFSHS